MLKKAAIVQFLLLFYIQFEAFSTHIVGGEFELVHLEAYNFKLRLIQYFDNFYGNPAAEDQSFNAIIYRKRDNQLIRNVFMARRTATPVSYTNPECAVAELSTKKIVYEADIVLNPNQFNDPEGYYVVWDRCCRNNVIDNIIAPDVTGQLFYLEFPPVVKNNQLFLNSSPILFPPLSDYACLNREFYADFAGVDPDGDSLVYSLADPLAGFSSPDMPKPDISSAAPYPTAQWESGLSVSNMIPGPRPLTIDREGLLKVIPDRTGLFVFAVKCEEFRDGVKIGEVRRDFQMLVIDCPDPGVAPQLTVKAPGSEVFYNHMDTLVFKSGDNLCLQAIVSDQDPNEKINLKIKPVNFNDPDLRNLIVDQGVIPDGETSVLLEYCVPECPYLPDGIAIIDLIASDDACSQPLMDSIRLFLKIEGPANQDPYFEGLPAVIERTMSLGDRFEVRLTGLDDDADSLSIDLEPVNFFLEDYGLRFRPVTNEDGKIEYIFSWDADCDAYDFSTQNEFTIEFKLNDHDYCNLNNATVLTIHIVVNDALNTGPKVSTSLPDTLVITRIEQDLVFDVFAVDPENDPVELKLVGSGYDPSGLGMVFEDKTGLGRATSRYAWRLNCGQVDLETEDTYQLYFVAEDNDLCQKNNADTAQVTVVVRPPRNNAPRVAMEFRYQYATIEMNPGQTLEFPVGAIDQDGDTVYLELENAEQLSEELGLEFTAVSGQGSATTSFSWKPDCDALGSSFSPLYYTFNFYTYDDKCFNSRSDSIKVNVIVKDLESQQEEFLPPNAFSPNGDIHNQSFFIRNLPLDNCNERFQSIAIYNRWGDLVFQDDNRDFEWNGNGLPTGVYFYNIKFSKSEYKGTISLLR